MELSWISPSSYLNPSCDKGHNLSGNQQLHHYFVAPQEIWFESDIDIKVVSTNHLLLLGPLWGFKHGRRDVWRKKWSAKMKSVVIMQSFSRGLSAQKLYRISKLASIRIQSMWRSVLHTRRLITTSIIVTKQSIEVLSQEGKWKHFDCRL